LLGLPADVPSTRGAAADLGRLLRLVPWHLRNRHRVRTPQPSARLAAPPVVRAGSPGLPAVAVHHASALPRGPTAGTARPCAGCGLVSRGNPAAARLRVAFLAGDRDRDVLGVSVDPELKAL